jgi:antitoxin Phd
MQTWPVQDAKARFCELLDTCLRDGPQLVKRRGAAVAVLVPADQWQRLAGTIRPTLKELLLTDIGRGDLRPPTRGHRHRRTAARSEPRGASHRRGHMM